MTADLELLTSFRGYFQSFSVDGKTGEGKITLGIPLEDKAKALVLTDHPGELGVLDFHTRVRAPLVDE